MVGKYKYGDTISFTNHASRMNVLASNLFIMNGNIEEYFNPFVQMYPFSIPSKTANRMVLMFSGGRERMHWEQMG